MWIDIQSNITSMHHIHLSTQHQPRKYLECLQKIPALQLWVYIHTGQAWKICLEKHCENWVNWITAYNK
jgi:predicted TIM-barrel fold metal-dependent hydrolase